MSQSSILALQQARVLVMGKRGGILMWPEQVMNGCQQLQVELEFGQYLAQLLSQMFFAPAFAEQTLATFKQAICTVLMV